MVLYTEEFLFQKRPELQLVPKARTVNQTNDSSDNLFGELEH